MKDSEVLSHLKTARDLIAEGFCKNVTHRSTSVGVQYCAVGAVEHAMQGIVYDPLSLGYAIVNALYERLPQEFKTASDHRWEKWRCVVDYNNHRDTTQADVVGVFDKTLADLGGLA